MDLTVFPAPITPGLLARRERCRDDRDTRRRDEEEGQAEPTTEEKVAEELVRRAQPSMSAEQKNLFSSTSYSRLGEIRYGVPTGMPAEPATPGQLPSKAAKCRGAPGRDGSASRTW